VRESVQDIKTIRLPAAAVGLLAGSGVAYLVNFFADFARVPEDIPGFYIVLMILLVPVIVFGVVASILWIRKPSSGSDALIEEFVIYFEIPFILLYFATCWLYWAVRV
jgi:hypothetical protein